MKRLLLTICACAALANLSARAEPYLAENLTVWLRADMGLTTNETGGVTAWANQGTKGSEVDVVPHADNSDGHVVYEASGIGGKPSLLFDGSVYLKTAAATDLGIKSSAGGGAWFVVFKTPCPRAERTNMGIMGSEWIGAPNLKRLGAFFVNDGTDRYQSWFSGNIERMQTSTNVTQIICTMIWNENGTTRAYPMAGILPGAMVQPGFVLGAAVFTVGNMVPSWMKTFKGEIAEIRIYDRPLTGRERSHVQFELFSRYGVHWEAHGIIDDNALRWHERSSQFGHTANVGVPEDMVSSASAGGATFTLGTPSAAEETYGYFTHNGGDGLSRIWYVSAFNKTKAGSAATFTFDRAKVHIGPNPSLYYKISYGGAWTKKDVAASEVDGNVSFTLPAGTWSNGFYAVFNDLDRKLAMWHRADTGVTTNAAGGVTGWTNYGTIGATLDMTPQADNSDAHIAYTAEGIGGKPTISFDGETYLQAAGSSNLGATSEGGAWFVVCKTDQTRAERGNKAIFGCANASGSSRLGAFFPANTDNVRGFFYNNPVDVDVAVETGNTQIYTLMQWTADNARTRYLMRNDMAGRIDGNTTASFPCSEKVRIGGNMFSWTGNFVGDIAEIRVYNRPLTKREHMAILFELCVRYGVSYSAIDNEGLSWCGNSAQLGYCEGYGLPEDIAVSATAGGATVSFDETPDPTKWTYSYLAHNGGNGLGRVWYFFISAAARALPMTFSVDSDIAGNTALGLYRSASSNGPWTRIGTCDSAVNGQYAFPFAANALLSGFYRVDRVKGTVLLIK